MLENLYTTKMSSSKKVLQKRFSKIRQKSGRFARCVSLIISLALVFALTTASVVMAALYNDDNEPYYFIELTNNDEKIELHNEPFVKSHTVYVPRRELLEKAGALDNKGSYINWNNGKLEIGIGKDADGTPLVIKYSMEIGKTELFCTPSDMTEPWNITPEQNQNPPILKNGVTYIPFNFADLLLNTMHEDRYIDYNIYDKDGNDARFTLMNGQTAPLSDAEAKKAAPNYVNEQRMCYEIIENFYAECYAGNVKEALDKYCTASMNSASEGDYEPFKAQLGTVYSIYLYPNDTYRVRYSLDYPNGDEQDFEAELLRQYDGGFLIDGMWSVFE